jgi:hypothetical protein
VLLPDVIGFFSDFHIHALSSRTPRGHRDVRKGFHLGSDHFLFANPSGMEPQATADGVQDERNTVDAEEGMPVFKQQRGFLNQLPKWSEFWRNEWLVMTIDALITCLMRAMQV